MDRNLTSCDNADEDYIDIEVSRSSSPSTNYFCYSINSPPHPREFEFQMSSTSLEVKPTTSPADELFYKGNLLPLHLPPRLQMVQKLLQNSSNSTFDDNMKTDPFEENCMTPFTTTNTTTSTPFESCNITPSGSCRVSRELNPEEYFFECNTDVSGFIADHPKKSWAKKLKLIKQSSLGMKLKASRAYLKSLFTKTKCSDDDVFVEATKKEGEETVSRAKESLNKYTKGGKKNPFGQIYRERYQVSDTLVGDQTEKEKVIEDGGTTTSTQRRSFSLSMKKHSSSKSTSFSLSSGSSSSSSSASSNGFYEVHLLKRCNSANSEIESSIQGAIAHCKQSQQAIGSRKTLSEVGFCSFSASRTCEDQEKPENFVGGETPIKQHPNCKGIER